MQGISFASIDGELSENNNLTLLVLNLGLTS